LNYNFEIAGLKVEPGTKQKGSLRIGPYWLHPREYIRHYVLMPFTVIRGAKDGPMLVQTAGCHPTEYAGIDATIRLSNVVDAKELKGTFVTVPCVNVGGFFERTYLNPFDGRNIQGLYPGKADGTISDMMAYTLFNEIVSKANYFVDCHGGCLNESELWSFIYYGTNDDIERKSEEIARATGLKYFWYSIYHGSLGMEAAKRGIPGGTYELNTAGRLYPEESSAIVEGTLNVMRHLGMLSGPPKPLKGQPGTTDDQKAEAYSVAGTAHFTKNGLYRSDVKAGNVLKEGDIVGRVVDFSGEVLETIRAPASGIVLWKIDSPVALPGDTAVVVHNKGKSTLSAT